MSNHTINSWKRYCLHHKVAIEDLRKRAISNAEKKAASKDKDATEASEVAPSTSNQATPQEVTPQQAIYQQQVLQQPVPQQPVPQQIVPQQPVLHQSSPQQHTLQQPTNPRESQPPPPPYVKVAQPEPILVKMEPLEDDQLDFAFATEVLSGWNANEESDAELWKRMESTVRSLAFHSGFRDG